MRPLLAGIVLFASLLPGSASQASTRDCAAPLRSRSASPIGTGPCPGVRPGAYYSSSMSSGCTFNFLFRGRDGYRYIGSAGHCFVNEGDVKTWHAGAGPTVRSDAGKLVGRAAYAVNDAERDFALVRLDHGAEAHPQMCHFGGPTDLDDSHPAEPVTLEHYGQGGVVSDVAPGRTAVATDMQREDVVIAAGVASFGDSGSGVMLEGRAVGVLVAMVLPEVGNIYITRLIPQLEEAEKAIGTRLTLLTAPRL